MNVFARKFLWVLDVVDCGGAATVVEWAKRTGYALAVKWNDGDPADDAKYGFQKGFKEVVALALPLGIPVLAWGYCYGDKYGNLEKEIAAVFAAYDAGAEGYIIDAESEWEVPEGKNWAKNFVDSVKRTRPEIPLAYCPFWNLRKHPNYPAKEFSKACHAVLPQVYYMLGQKTFPSTRQEMHRWANEDYGPLGLPVYPVGQFCGYRDGKWDAQETEGTMEFIQNMTGKPHSLWLLDGQVPEMDYRGINLTALEAMHNLATAHVEPTIPVLNLDPVVVSILDFIEELETALSKLRKVLESL
jgi:hypothetical protein